MSKKYSPEIIANNTEGLSRFEVSLLIVGLLAAIVIISALGFYYSVFNGTLSGDQEAWGMFGDYIGGTLNPLLSFATILILIFTGFFQRKDAEEARKALTESNASLRKQVEIQEDQAAEQSIYKLLEDIRRDLNFHEFKNIEKADSLLIGIYSLWKAKKNGEELMLRDFEYEEFDASIFMQVIMPKMDIFFELIKTAKRRKMYGKLLQVEIGSALSLAISSYSCFGVPDLFKNIVNSQGFIQGLNPWSVYLEELLCYMECNDIKKNENFIDVAKYNFELREQQRLDIWNRKNDASKNKEDEGREELP